MNSRLFFTLLLSSLFCTCVRAQTNWQAGYITTLDGTRQEGEINATFSEEHLTDIQFRPSAAAASQNLPIADLKAFGTTADHFQVHDITVNASPRSVQKAVMEVNQATEQTSGALLEIISGPLSLLEYRDKLGQAQFFLMRENERPQYLPYAQYLVETEDGGRRLRRNKEYLLVLNQLLGDCATLLPQIQAATYLRKEMEKLVLDYYDCKQLGPAEQKARPKGHLRFGPTLGLHYRDFARKSPAPPMGIYNWGTSVTSLSPMIGFELRYWLSQYGPLSIKTAVFYTNSQKNKQRDTSQPGSMLTSERKLDFSASTLSVYFGAAYRIKKGKFPVNVEIGTSISKLLDIQDKRYSRTGTFEQFSVLAYETPLGWGVYGGASVDLSSFTLSLRYEGHSFRQKERFTNVSGPALTASYLLR